MNGYAKFVNQNFVPMKFNPNLDLSNARRDPVSQKLLQRAFPDVAEEKETLFAKGDGSCLGI